MAQPPQSRSDMPGPRRQAGLVALDLDGTVFAPDGHVSPRTRDAIAALVADGTRVAIATGRSWWESRSVIAEAGVAGPGVFAGGAIVNDMTDGRSLWSSRMPPSLARDICRLIAAAGLTVMVLQDRNHAPSEWLIAAEGEMPDSMPRWLAIHGSTYHRVPDLATATHEWTVRLSTIAPREVHAQLAQTLADQIGERAYLHEIIVPGSGVSVLEIFDADVNKWTGIRRLAAELNIDESAIVAVGDDMNDLPMLRSARLGAVMGNARDALLDALDGHGRRIGSNAQDGLAVFLERLLTHGMELNNEDPNTDEARDRVSGREGF